MNCPYCKDTKVRILNEREKKMAVAVNNKQLSYICDNCGGLYLPSEITNLKLVPTNDN